MVEGDEEKTCIFFFFFFFSLWNLFNGFSSVILLSYVLWRRRRVMGNYVSALHVVPSVRLSKVEDLKGYIRDSGG